MYSQSEHDGKECRFNISSEEISQSSKCFWFVSCVAESIKNALWNFDCYMQMYSITKFMYVGFKMFAISFTVKMNLFTEKNLAKRERA